MKRPFKRKATITTSNNDKYKIESSRYFIMPMYKNKHRIRHKYGNAFTITKVLPPEEETLKPNDISFIGEIYSFDDNRLRFLQDTYKDATAFDTEMHDNGKELPITVIEKYDQKVQTIESIGDIVKFESDIDSMSYMLDIKVLRLLMKEKKSNNKKDL